MGPAFADSSLPKPITDIAIAEANNMDEIMFMSGLPLTECLIVEMGTHDGGIDYKKLNFVSGATAILPPRRPVPKVWLDAERSTAALEGRPTR
ncbi:hypothetical protein [Bradyrhizobium valentinum]|uniref:Uncharacterized protein n=1 Tax=Bradyrhizobium valentinum TaxID=1518501 RepID=A0A0R3L6B6_9BRAD|nr:hypothetical protein [Bradyrhizobium valentinum]KRR03370.1 hypothetical protein CP49_10090 [Bradyrhizobium valentinum]